MYKNFANQSQQNPHNLDKLDELYKLDEPDKLDELYKLDELDKLCELDKLKSSIFAPYFLKNENENFPVPTCLCDRRSDDGLLQGFQLQRTLPRCHRRLRHHQPR